MNEKKNFSDSESDDVVSTNLNRDKTPIRNFAGTFQANTDLALSARQRLHLDISNKYPSVGSFNSPAPHSMYQFSKLPLASQMSLDLTKVKNRFSEAPHNREFKSSIQ